MSDDRGSVLTLIGDSMDNSSSFLEPKPHIVNRTSHPIRAMPNLCPFDSYQNKYTGETPLTFYFFYIYTYLQMNWVCLINWVG